MASINTMEFGWFFVIYITNVAGAIRPIKYSNPTPLFILVGGLRFSQLRLCDKEPFNRKF
jgi:hypothetical protein